VTPPTLLLMDPLQKERSSANSGRAGVGICTIKGRGASSELRHGARAADDTVKGGALRKGTGGIESQRRVVP